MKTIDNDYDYSNNLKIKQKVSNVKTHSTFSSFLFIFFDHLNHPMTTEQHNITIILNINILSFTPITDLPPTHSSHQDNKLIFFDVGVFFFRPT